MRRQLMLWILLAVFGFGCGGDSGSPGSSGYQETGTQLSIWITSSEPNVDCFQNMDCNQDGETDDPEEFMDQFVTATITATTYDNPTESEDTGSGSNIYLERYTIDYISENPAAPPLRSREIFNTIFIPAPETEDEPIEVIVDVVLADLQTKREFREAIQDGSGIIADPSAYPVRYNVVYNFYGQNEFGHNVNVRVTTQSTFGAFDNCD